MCSLQGLSFIFVPVLIILSQLTQYSPLVLFLLYCTFRHQIHQDLLICRNFYFLLPSMISFSGPAFMADRSCSLDLGIQVLMA